MGNSNSQFNSSSTSQQVIDANVPEKYTNYLTVITGCNTGIGLDTAKNFYRKGAHVVMACRSMDRMQEAKKTIQDEIKEGGELECMTLDLGSLQSIQDFVEEFKKKHDKLNSLILNAGVMACPLGRTKDGFEMQMGTNHFGHFALTLQLLPYMTGVPDARVVSVSSNVHKIGNMYYDGNDLNWEKRKYSSWGAYAQSKLANVLFVKELQKRLNKSEQGKNITALAVDPGSIKTDLQRHSALSNVLQTLMPFINKTIPQGASTTVNCATNPEFKGKGGTYFVDCNEATPHSKALDEQVATQLWEISEKLTKTSFPL
jgi:NAD(P)-dependent dehydrogenase (short-subunit alcohol dehydrogenase family)